MSVRNQHSKQSFEDYFWSRTRPCANGCTLWLGAPDKDGYGKVHIAGGKFARATRVAWRLAKDFDPGDLYVLHRCDNPQCVNPDHLFLGTNQDNIADRMRKGRGIKLDAHKVREIRAMKAAGFTTREIAPKFGINPSKVSEICTGKRWGHVR